MNLKSKKSELMTEKRLFEQKKNRAARRVVNKKDHLINLSSSSSPSPQPRSDTSDRSQSTPGITSPLHSQLDTMAIANSASESQHLSVSQGSQDDPIDCESASDSDSNSTSSAFSPSHTPDNTGAGLLFQ